jgi:hypothetical protein
VESRGCCLVRRSWAYCYSGWFRRASIDTIYDLMASRLPRAVGGPRRLGEHRQRFCSQREDVGSGIAHLHMACLHNLLHAPHFACLEPDLDAARVEGGCCQDVFHDATGQSPGTLVVLLRDVHPEPWLDVFAVLPVHAFASFTLQPVVEMPPRVSHKLPGAPVSPYAPASS